MLLVLARQKAVAMALVAVEDDELYLAQKSSSGDFVRSLEHSNCTTYSICFPTYICLVLVLDVTFWNTMGTSMSIQSSRAMLEPTQILEGNEINFALCAVWHAFGLCSLLFLLLRAPFFHDQDEEERGKMSRLPQRLLLRDAELRFMEFQKCMTNGMKKKADSKFGLILCDLDRLYKAVEFHAKKTGEWSSVRQDIVDLANPHMRMSDRLVVLSRLKEMYYCLLPSPSPSMYYPPSL